MKSQEVIEMERELEEAQAWLDAAGEKLRLAEKEYQAAVENMGIVRGG